MLCYTVLYYIYIYTVVYYTILYYTILYYTILYYTDIQDSCKPQGHATPVTKRARPAARMRPAQCATNV